MKAHIIENNKVVNTIEVDSLDFLPSLIDGSVGGIGWEYTNGELIPPYSEPLPIEVPTMLTPLQAKLQLLDMELLDEVEAMVAADRRIALYWNEALEIRRDHPTLIAMAGALGLTDEQLDEMFIEAGKLQ